MEKQTVLVKLSHFAPEFGMIITIPDDRDAEEYIDEMLDNILKGDLSVVVEWDFVDGLPVKHGYNELYNR